MRIQFLMTKELPHQGYPRKVGTRLDAVYGSRLAEQSKSEVVERKTQWLPKGNVASTLSPRRCRKVSEAAE